MKNTLKIRLPVILLIFILLISIPAGAESFQSSFDFLEALQTEAAFLDSLLEARIEKMTLKEKIGQLFLFGFSGTKLNDKIRDLIENEKLGGVIYFNRNIEDLAQIAELSNQLQSLALNRAGGIPLFTAVDQEGGKVRRIEDLIYFPSNKVLGRKKESRLTKKIGEITAIELKNLGININLAPVLDINNNPANPVIGDRSYGSDKKLVARLGRAYIKGLQSEKVAAAAKHFPGHGDTKTDSHYKLPVINHPLSRLEEIELYPFKKAIAAGVEIIMTAHIYFPALAEEKGLPASLSRAVQTDLLRKKLAFKGLIMTDDLEMEAVEAKFSTAEAALRAVEAGSDLILIAHSYQKQKSALEALLKAVKSGRINEKRIDQSVKRILKLKGKIII